MSALKLRRRAHTDGSYLSASDIRVHFGLGAWTQAVTVLVEWPGGPKEEFGMLQVDRTVLLRQGSGKL